jgi:sigma-B regulation protein RsbU (phosphoserine phosphatase)
MAGAFEQASYETGRIQLKPGDSLFFFTDGVTESVNMKGEFFSDERLRTLLERLPGSSAEEIVREVVNEVRIFSTGETASDDVTAMALNFRG